MTQVKLMVEKIADDNGSVAYYIVTAMDEVGILCVARNYNREKAISTCRNRVHDILKDCEFVIQDLVEP